MSELRKGMVCKTVIGEIVVIADDAKYYSAGNVLHYVCRSARGPDRGETFCRMACNLFPLTVSDFHHGQRVKIGEARTTNGARYVTLDGDEVTVADGPSHSGNVRLDFRGGALFLDPACLIPLAADAAPEEEKPQSPRIADNTVKCRYCDVFITGHQAAARNGVCGSVACSQLATAASPETPDAATCPRCQRGYDGKVCEECGWPGLKALPGEAVVDVYAEHRCNLESTGAEANTMDVVIHAASVALGGTYIGNRSILGDGRTSREKARDRRWRYDDYTPKHCKRCGHDRGCMCPRGA